MTLLPFPHLLDARPFRLTDLRIYSAQVRKILMSTLYYLEVQADGQLLYKIGVTTRPITKRLVEVYRDMRSHFQTVAINVLGTWTNRGNLEKYFKYRYSDFNYPIGNLTEYFKFVDLNDAQAVQHDLRSMDPKVLSLVEQDILNGKGSPTLVALTQQQMHQAPEGNGDISCPINSESV